MDEHDYSNMEGHGTATAPPLTAYELSRLRSLLNMPTKPGNDPTMNAQALSTEDAVAALASISTDSDYPHFHESTHAWAVFGTYQVPCRLCL